MGEIMGEMVSEMRDVGGICGWTAVVNSWDVWPENHVLYTVEAKI